MKLQAREKILLFILILVALVVIPLMFLIMPAVQANQAKQAELDALMLTNVEASTAAVSSPELEQLLAGMQADAESNAIPGRMKAYDIHYFAEDICNATGVALDSLSVSEYEQVTVRTAEGDTAQQEGNLLYKCRLEMQLAGSFQQLMNTVDSFAGYEYIVISRCNMNDIPNGAPIECNLGVDIYAVLQPGDADFVMPPEPVTEIVEAEAEES